jgi:hypothetical protein
MNAKAKEAQEKYLKGLEEKKAEVRKEPNPFKRFWKRVWLLIEWPFLWVWASCKDWRVFVVFASVLLIVSSEVWVPYSIALFVTDEIVRGSLLSVATACWLFWLAPGTPFIPLCIFVTMGIMEIIYKIERGKNAKGK